MEQDIDDGIHYSDVKYKHKQEVDHIMVVAPPHLLNVSIKGNIATFDRLSKLFQLAPVSLESIKLNIRPCTIVDPNQIITIPAHIKFDYRIAYDSFELPADFNWSTHIDAFTQRPALRYEERVLCSVPSFTEKSVFRLLTPNIFITSPHILFLPKVHTLVFEYIKFRVNTDTVVFIRHTFPSIHTIVWRLSKLKLFTDLMPRHDKSNYCSLNRSQNTTRSAIVVSECDTYLFYMRF
ncbi:unnamed protein product [Rotaria socialis]|uniref:Uncharacterized protein n=1 Tax=Rotaria socialis TaxID=392032 RepID=A0A818E8M0_9BILA|nr:unnamed protein product [Rotaria socialis]CAF3455446.1 unnamed protein product [Rotaria socialis]CAF3513659.1 unnamed protein product [Rotaria socialis]CAF3633041.1 unnamed protein product [Rotaria socialis]CAF3775893.1 unnamed protein product [Rotaria socialis]